MADELTIKVVSSTSESLLVRLDLASASVLSLKQFIEHQDAHRFPVAAQRLIFQGQILQDAKSLTEYHVTTGCALHLTLSPNGTATATAAETFPPHSQLTTFLQQMRDGESSDAYALAVRTLQKICVNIVDHPTEDKYRKLRVDNAALKEKLFDRTRGRDSVHLLGFQDGVLAGHLVLVPTPEKWENLMACKNVLDSVATTLAGNATPFFASGGGATTLTSGGGDFASQAQSLLQNPTMLHSMASNPLMRQLSQHNPILTQALQNPALLAQSMQALQQNPAMMQQISQMVSDPNAMARMQQMMGGGGMGGLGSVGSFASSGPASLSAAASPSNTDPFASVTPTTPSAASMLSLTPRDVTVSSSTPPAPAGDDTYDEDEIANAIARSLQDQ
uniref:Ubiquitin-like domain-containing protein n=1 Tax=Peronospora matthiolae TaxID=2874970 RepID=A0AAV1T9X3_9STRA